MSKGCGHSKWHINPYDGTCTYLVETACVDGVGAKMCGVKRK